MLPMSIKIKFKKGVKIYEVSYFRVVNAIDHPRVLNGQVLLKVEKSVKRGHRTTGEIVSRHPIGVI